MFKRLSQKKGKETDDQRSQSGRGWIFHKLKSNLSVNNKINIPLKKRKNIINKSNLLSTYHK